MTENNEPDINTQPKAWAKHWDSTRDWKVAIGTRPDGSTFEFEVFDSGKGGWFARGYERPMRECDLVVLRDDPSVVIKNRHGETTA